MSDIEVQSPARYRLQVIINRDLVSPPDGLDEVVSFELGKLADAGYSCLAHNVNKLKERPQKKRLGEFTVDDVIPFITSLTQKEYTVNGQTYIVKMNSARYFVFRDNLSCVACGIIGTKMMLEQHPGDKTAHFNLYAEEDGELVLMTKDHIRAKSKNGPDELHNFTTMCCVCNNIKADYPITLEQLRTVRYFHNMNKNLMTKRDLSKLTVEKVRQMTEENLKNAVDHIPSYLTSYNNVVETACQNKEENDYNLQSLSHRVQSETIGDLKEELLFSEMSA